MGALHPLNVQAARHLLRWRTRLNRTTTIRHLDLLAVAISHAGRPAPTTRGARAVRTTPSGRLRRVST